MMSRYLRSCFFAGFPRLRLTNPTCIKNAISTSAARTIGVVFIASYLAQIWHFAAFQDLAGAAAVPYLDRQ